MAPRILAPGPPPSIASCKAVGNVGIVVFCQGRHFVCAHSASLLWERLGLPDATPFPDIARLRSFVCSRCGERDKVQIMPDRGAQTSGGLAMKS